MKTTVIIPTFNEKENIAELIDRINSIGIEGLEIIVSDDNSPDGTWGIVEEKKKESTNVKLLRRFSDRGRGFAVRDAFRLALENGSDFSIEMDGDLSHPPESVPFLIEALKDYDVVIGSRFIEGGKVERTCPIRNLFTSCAHKYLRALFGYRVKDPTSGFRGFTKKALEKINPSTLKAPGYFGVTEILCRCHREGLSIKEVPITFKDRAGGDSKLAAAELIKYLWKALLLRFRRR